MQGYLQSLFTDLFSVVFPLSFLLHRAENLPLAFELSHGVERWKHNGIGRVDVGTRRTTNDTVLRIDSHDACAEPHLTCPQGWQTHRFKHLIGPRTGV